MENLYTVLEVSEDADYEEIKKNFRRLAKQCHPDIAKGSDEQFRQISHAYKILSNIESRNDYDKTLKNFREKTGKFAEYHSNSYTVEGKHLKTMMKGIRNYGQFTSIKVKYKDKKLFSLSYPVAAALSVVGLIKAPISFLLLQIGIGAFFTIEVTNQVMTLFEEALARHNEGSILGAEQLYKKILGKSEYFIPARINLGLLYRQRGESKKAMQCFKTVLEAVPFGEIGEMARKNLEELRGF
jgi:curved DNA-binding protein CbpA